MRRKRRTDNSEFIWSDNWYILENEAWFVSGQQDILFCINTKTGNTTLAREIPERRKSFRLHPKCLKFEDIVFCFPDIGENIWCYHISTDDWKKIIVDNPQKVRISCSNFWIIEEKLYIVSIGLKQILEVDISKEIVTAYYNLPIENDGKVSGSILVGQWIYLVGVSPVCIYKFDCLTKKFEMIQLSNLNDSIHTISYDGEKFWLSGHCRKIYVWQEISNKIFILDSLPDEFGIWNFSGKYDHLLNYHVDSIEMPLFMYSVYVDQYVWFIPAQSNEILYIDKDTYKIKIFHLEDEEQTDENVKVQLLRHKYLLEYVWDEKYIGLYSLKNRQIVEIDTQKLLYKVLQCCINDQHICQIRKVSLDDAFCLGDSVYEQDVMSLDELVEYIRFKDLDKRFYTKNEIEGRIVGREIYVGLK